MDETWAHHLDAETKLQSKQWKHAATSLTPVNSSRMSPLGKLRQWGNYD